VKEEETAPGTASRRITNGSNARIEGHGEGGEIGGVLTIKGIIKKEGGD